MGIHDLLPFLRKLAAPAFRKPDLPAGCAVAVDTSIFMYKFAYSVGTGKRLCSRMLQFNNEIVERGYRPIFVFDGDPLPDKEREREKRLLLQARRKQLFEMRESLTQLTCSDGIMEIEVEKSYCPSVRPLKEDFQALKLALESLDIETATAKYEAEALCSELCVSGRAHAILTEDSDCLAYLANNVLLHWSNDTEEVVSAEIALSTLQLSPDQFQDLCVLLGNDFNERVKGIGPVKALALLKKHGSLDSVLESLKVSDEVSVMMKRSRHIFKTRCFESSLNKNESTSAGMGIVHCSS